jgi:uncharacterized damage-inducible protein DinB
MSDIQFLRDQLRKGFSDDPWHGPATTVLLGDVTAEEAAAYPVPGAHCVWEIVLHMISWQNEVRRRLSGRQPDMPEEGDWPEVVEVSAEAWRRDQERLAASLDEVLKTLGDLRDGDLDRTGGSLSDRDPALGTGVTLRAMVNGLVQHTAYHSGQIALLRKALRQGRD